MDFFSNFFTGIDLTLNNYFDEKIVLMMDYVSPVIHTASILLIIGIGLGMLFGKIETPFYKMIYSLGIIVLVMQFGTNLGVYNDYCASFFRDLPDEVLTIVSNYTSSAGIGETLDNFGTSALTGISNIQRSASGPVSGLQAIVISTFILIIWLIMSVLIMISMLLVKIVLTILMATGPLFIFCLLLPQTKDFFSKWLGYVIQFIVLAILIGSVLGIIQDSIITYLDAFKDASSTIDFVAFSAPLIVMVLVCYIFMEIPNIAGSLTGGIGMAIGGMASQIASNATRIVTKPARYGVQRKVGETLDARKRDRQMGKLRKARTRTIEKEKRKKEKKEARENSKSEK